MDGAGWADSRIFDDSPPAGVAPKRIKLEPQEASPGGWVHQRAAWQVGEQVKLQAQMPWMVDEQKGVKVESPYDQPLEMQVYQHRLLRQGNSGWWEKHRVRETTLQGFYQRYNNNNNSSKELGDERFPEQQMSSKALERRQVYAHRGAPYPNTNPLVQHFACSERESVAYAPPPERQWTDLPPPIEVGASSGKSASRESERERDGHVTDRQENGR